MNIFNWLPAGARDSILRHFLTAGGGVLISKGLINEAMLEQVIGALMTLFGVVWALGNKADEAAATDDKKTTTKK